MTDFTQKKDKEKELPSKVLKSFESLGIQKDEVQNLKSKLLNGKRTDIIEIPRFKNLNIKASFEIDKTNDSLKIFTPNFKEQDINKSVDSLKKIPGIISNKTDYVNKNILDKGFDFDKVTRPDKIKENHTSLENYVGKKLDIKESTPDTWLKVNNKFAKEIDKKSNIPVIKSGGDHFIGLQLNKIDNHSLDQHKFAFSKISKDLDISANKENKLSR